MALEEDDSENVNGASPRCPMEEGEGGLLNPTEGGALSASSSVVLRRKRGSGQVGEFFYFGGRPLCRRASVRLEQAGFDAIYPFEEDVIARLAELLSDVAVRV